MKNLMRLTIIFYLTVCSVLSAAGSNTLSGEWVLITEKSSDISLYKMLKIEILTGSDSISILQQWGSGKRIFKNKISVSKGVGKVVNVPVVNRVFPYNVFMGISMTEGTERIIKTEKISIDTLLILSEHAVITCSQGRKNLSITHKYSLRNDGTILIYKVSISTRSDSFSYNYVLKRMGERDAWFYRLSDNWNVEQGLNVQAFLISVQGLVNRSGPRLYFIYPETWDFRFTPGVMDFLKSKLYYTFHELKTYRHVFNKFSNIPKGYVVWDRNVRSSLIVAFTAAGVKDAVVVDEELIPIVKKAGLSCVEDFRGRFRGWSDAQIFGWARSRYWNECSHNLLVWLGGQSGKVMKPGVADWGVSKKAFFLNLSTKPEDAEEYELAKKFLADLKPMSIIFGWHSYAKDKERDYVTLTSKFGHRVEGLHTLPNLSFFSQVPASPGFVFKNNHNLKQGKVYKPQKKVYIACVQTDCLGLGAWTRPGRGEVPYAWEVPVNWYWLAPAMLQFFYSQATYNDYFIGALSGPGYLYPKAVPEDLLPVLITKADSLMKKLDLNIFEIMDYSEGATVEGNTELNRRVVEEYYKCMPQAIGFINGYAPAHTFTVIKNRPLISFDYYLSPERNEEDAAEDLRELSRINSTRPYFLLMHVRQWSDISRVKSILKRLGNEFEVVPLDVFLKMAGEHPTFREKFLIRKGKDR